jgi:hypothetical protein
MKTILPQAMHLGESWPSERMANIREEEGKNNLSPHLSLHLFLSHPHTAVNLYSLQYQVCYVRLLYYKYQLSIQSDISKHKLIQLLDDNFRERKHMWLVMSLSPVTWRLDIGYSTSMSITRASSSVPLLFVIEGCGVRLSKRAAHSDYWAINQCHSSTGLDYCMLIAQISAVYLL